MLILDGGSWVFLASIGWMVACAVFALFARSPRFRESVRRLELTDAQRLSLARVLVEKRKRDLQERKHRRERGLGSALPSNEIPGDSGDNPRRA